MSLAKKSFSLLKRDGFLFIANTFTSIYIARVLGPTVMGVWVILSLIPVYAESFGRLKFDSAAVYYLGQGNYSEKAVERTLNSIALIVSLIIGIPLLLFSPNLCRYMFGGSLEELFFVRLMILQIPFTFLYMNYCYLIIFKENTKVYNQMTIIKALVGSLGALFLIFIFDLQLEGIVYASVLSVFLSFLFGYFRSDIAKEKGLSLLNFAMIRDFRSFSMKMYLAGIVGNFNVYIIRTMLIAYLAPAKMAFFSIAQDRASFLNKIPDSMNIMLFSRISKLTDHTEKNILAAKGIRVIAIGLIISGIIALLAIKPMVILLYGMEYLPVVEPFYFIIPGVVAYGLISVMIQYFNGIGKTNLQIWIFCFITIFQVILAILLIEDYGIMGASVTFSLSMIFSLVISFYLFLRESKESLSILYLSMSDVYFILNFLNDFLPAKLRLKSSLLKKKTG